jgi:hypothetical protein
VPFGPDWGRLRVGNRREGQIPEKSAVGAGPEGGKGAAFGDQEAVSGDTERGVVLKTTPAAPLVIGKAQFLIVARDPSAQFCEIAEAIKTDVLGWRGELEADLKNFFGSLDHDWLLQFVQHRVGDRA